MRRLLIIEQRFIDTPRSFRLVAVLRSLLRAFQIDMQAHIVLCRLGLFLRPGPGGAQRRDPRRRLRSQ